MSKLAIAAHCLALLIARCARPAHAQFFDQMSGAGGHPPNIEGFTVAGKGVVAAKPDLVEIDLDVVAGKPRPGTYRYAINNSFGFGGHNVAIAFGRY